jgi:hypothetical protein
MLGHTRGALKRSMQHRAACKINYKAYDYERIRMTESHTDAWDGTQVPPLGAWVASLSPKSGDLGIVGESRIKCTGASSGRDATCWAGEPRAARGGLMDKRV